ncbi:ABC transporter ATP-binding protein [Treponema sp. OttesenSCG-928-L16]|nr:ABC transporter ATP-binding protein [Treponema sp. OttesenSCG-928-L16]
MNTEKQETRAKILEVRNLSIEYATKEGLMRAVDDVSFDLHRGQSLGIVGESGCGKTTLIKSILRLLPKNGYIAAGTMRFGDEKLDLAGLPAEEMRKVQLADIALVSQSAMNSLNPVYTIGWQLIEGIRAHRRVSKQEARKRAVEVFSMVGLEEKRLDAYPHQLSGGMKQRAIIAMALSLNPSLVIADEPTTALDVVVQGRILRRIREIQRQVSSSMIFITHDISVVGEICETIMVMYGGKVMELAPADAFFRAPYHPYSLGLQKAFPDIVDRNVELVSIPGTPPNLMEEQTGCRFAPRCPFAQDTCRGEAPPLRETGAGHSAACWYIEEVQRFRKEAALPETWERVRERLASGEEYNGGTQFEI